ncbi:MAG TPA: glycosyl hydrolase family 65 protein [Herpetosiphonaceae bacterium]
MTMQRSQNIWELDSDPRWLMTIDGWNPQQEPGIEAVLALLNGYAGTRAAIEEGSSKSLPATFLNGVFDAATQAVAQAGATPDFQVIAAPTPELVVAPDWSRLRILADEQPLRIESAELIEQRRTLDFHRGVLLREWRLRHGDRITRLRSLRFASLHDRHILAQALEITPENWQGKLTIEAIVEGAVTNEGNTRHLVNHQTSDFDHGMLLTTETSEQQIKLCFATAGTLQGAQFVVTKDVRPQSLIQRWTVTAAQSQPVIMHKLVTVFTSRDDDDPATRAVERLTALMQEGLPTLLDRSIEAWDSRWRTADVTISGDEEIQRQTRFALYHLIGSANPEDEHASPGARSLTGERYKGHVFWDTEIFVFPFFVYTHPPTARALLMYRYHTLPAARDKARAHGYRGALYAWESTDSGVDVTPPFVYNSAGERLEILTGIQEHHISADVAYALWQYWHATQDEAFLVSAGAEMLLEMARFWASRAERGDDGRYHIRTVIGPDEFHEHADDNAYTNRMASWVLRRGLEIVDWLRAEHPQSWHELATQISFDDGELAAWREVADGLVDNFDPATGLFEQHRGYYDLEYIDLQSYEPRNTTMDVLLGWQRLTKTQIIKQADVVMLLFLLGDRYPREIHEANFRFYEPRTSHDSSLSPSFHALAAARLGETDLARRYFTKAANIDLDFTRGVTAAGGVHIAALGGMWQALVFGFGGMFVEASGLRFDPHVPKEWGEISFSVQWRGSTLRASASGTTADVSPPALGF